MDSAISKALKASAASRRKHKHKGLLLLLAVAVGAVIIAVLVFALSKAGDNELAPEDDALTQDLKNTPALEPVNSSSSTNNELYEKHYKTYLSDVKSTLSVLQDVLLYKDRADNIQRDVDNSLGLYNAGDMLGAEAKIVTALEAADALFRDRSQRVEAQRLHLEAAFDSQQLAAAQTAFKAIAAIAPFDERLDGWRNRLARLPELIAATKAAQRARVENRLDEELQQLEKANQIAPGNQQVESRIAAITAIISDNNYYQLIENTRKALAQKEVAVAQRNLNLARGIKSTGAEVTELTKRLDRLTRTMDLAEHLKRARQAEQADDWESARQGYSLALKRVPSSVEAREGLAKSESTLRAINELNSLVSRPLRLTDKTIAEYAKGVLASSVEFADRSPSVSRLRADLSRFMTLASNKRDVPIVSDGKTTIKVQGLGYLTPTLGRSLALTPGHYRLFAECKGFKQNIVELSVPMEGEIKPLRVVCDERI